MCMGILVFLWTAKKHPIQFCSIKVSPVVQSIAYRLPRLHPRCMLNTEFTQVMQLCSLIPRPSHHPTAVCKNGGGRPGTMNDINIYLGRQRREGPLKEKVHFVQNPSSCTTSDNLKYIYFCFPNIQNSNIVINV